MSGFRNDWEPSARPAPKAPASPTKARPRRLTALGRIQRTLAARAAVAASVRDQRSAWSAELV
jgi:hypothetical protein